MIRLRVLERVQVNLTVRTWFADAGNLFPKIRLARDSGVDRSTLRNIRGGTTGPTFKVLIALSEPLGVRWSRLAELMYGGPVRRSVGGCVHEIETRKRIGGLWWTSD
jgi:transcriptional regulator with XRE-family HTH domain